MGETKTHAVDDEGRMIGPSGPIEPATETWVVWLARHPEWKSRAELAAAKAAAKVKP